MRKLIILRGIPGCGKSTFIREQKLEPYTLSADSIRMLYGNPVMTPTGQMRISADHDRQVWDQLFELLESRMKRGELTVIDATHISPKSFGGYQKLVREYRYSIICVDFSDVDFDVADQRNAARELYQIVPELEMRWMHKALCAARVPGGIKVVKPDGLTSVLAFEPINVNRYRAIHHIGDLQGCFDPLQQYFDSYPIQDNELYVFSGDYLDRGTQNAEVLRWLLENYERPNFIFVEGNHEAHLRKWSQGRASKSRQFMTATKRELQAGHINPKEVRGFLDSLREVFYYRFDTTHVVVTHGGLSQMPHNLTYVSSLQLVKGVGSHEDHVIADTAFMHNAPDNTYQVHGHRNTMNVPIRANDRCFNLEGQIEFAGELRVVVLDETGFHERPVKSLIDATSNVIGKSKLRHISKAAFNNRS